MAAILRHNGDDDQIEVQNERQNAVDVVVSEGRVESSEIASHFEFLGYSNSGGETLG